MTIMGCPAAGSYPPYYDTYFETIDFNKDIKKSLDEATEKFLQLTTHLDISQLQYAYAEGKWTVSQVLLHIADCELIFNYRICSILRDEKQSLPGFDENVYAEKSKSLNYSLEKIVDYFVAVRELTKTQLLTTPIEKMNQTGIANANIISVKALYYIIIAHQLHHLYVIKERYKIA